MIGGACQEPSSDTPFFVARLRGDTGLIDSSFGVNGFGLGHFLSGNMNDSAYSIAFDQGGRPLVAGSTSPSSTDAQTSLAGVARLTYDLIFANNFDENPRGCLPPDCE
jgi:hypothetical protein